MWFGGFQPFTLSDYPGCIAAIAFTQGCNFRCRFCHNAALLRPANPEDGGLLTDAAVLAKLAARRGKLQGLVVSGGEPTLWEGLPVFLGRVRQAGFKVKLDTNGSRPEMLAGLVRDRQVDYIAMDVKAPPQEYDHVCGVPVDVRAVQKSIELIAASDVSHHFRTTFSEAFISEDGLARVKAMIPPGSTHIVQPFQAVHALDSSLRRQPAT